MPKSPIMATPSALSQMLPGLRSPVDDAFGVRELQALANVG